MAGAVAIGLGFVAAVGRAQPVGPAFRLGPKPLTSKPLFSTADLLHTADQGVAEDGLILSGSDSPWPGGRSRPSDPEREMTAALRLWQSAHPREAIARMESLLHRQPNFRLGQMVYSQMLAVRSGRSDAPVAANDPRVRDLLEEGRLRLAAQNVQPPATLVPSPILELSDNVHYALAIDLSRARLYVLENLDGRPRVIRDQYAAMARNGAGKQTKGDLRTPIGVYFVTDFLDDAALPELYGAGAFPLDYPNAWDARLGRSGSGIWLHGVPRDTFARVPRSSEGCVTMSNPDLVSLKPYIRAGQTPVIVADRLNWVAPASTNGLRNDITGRIAAWSDAQSARNATKLVDLYAVDFVAADGRPRASYAIDAHRRLEQARLVTEAVSDLSLFRYPTPEPLVMARFTETTQVDGARAKRVRRQFWRQDADGAWRILREDIMPVAA